MLFVMSLHASIANLSVMKLVFRAFVTAWLGIADWCPSLSSSNCELLLCSSNALSVAFESMLAPSSSKSSDNLFASSIPAFAVDGLIFKTTSDAATEMLVSFLTACKSGVAAYRLLIDALMRTWFRSLTDFDAGADTWQAGTSKKHSRAPPAS